VVHAIARYKLIDYLRRTEALIADVPIDEANDVLGEDDHASVESAYSSHAAATGLITPSTGG
jgi:RNA polymerase sigma-70 factor (ECF subfamily)